MSTKKILLVDDSATMLLMEQMVLDSSGYQILIARDGEAGLRAARAHRPDLILLDVTAPKLDGFEACEATCEIPILRVTKPVQGDELLSKVKNLLGD